jgi:predicted transcriptional regulator
MDISSVGSLSTALNSAQTGSEVGMTVLKKAIDIQAQGVLQLLQAVPQVSSNPPNLGNSVDVRA